MKTIKARKYSYGAKRPYDDVHYIIIHYTAGKGDTAVGEGKYFRDFNIRNAGAHFFIGQDGDIVKSVPLNRVAWAVGGNKYADCNKTGGGKYYKSATNYNSVSIELCDNLDKDPSEKQIKAVIKCIRYIRKYCTDTYYIIRHFDVNGKHCPARMCCSKNADAKWIKFKSRVFKESGMNE